jgi:hypothetical protein
VLWEDSFIGCLCFGAIEKQMDSKQARRELNPRKTKKFFRDKKQEIKSNRRSM